jgi:L-iditol 2-dehydrogenase
MKVAVLTKIREIRIQERDIPKISHNECLVRIRCVGVCGSDVHYYLHGRIGSQVAKPPHILGHESAGEVVQVGANVTNVKKGDKVAVEPGVPCRNCENCKAGHYNLCQDIRFLGTPPVPGAYVEYMAVPSDFVFPIAERMNFDDAAMIEPLAVAVHAVNLGKVKPGASIAVLGAGSIGLLTMQTALACGATRAFITDPLGYRLAYAEKYGATAVLNPKETDVVQAILDLTNSRGVDVAFEAAGAEDTPNQGLKIVKRGGRFVWIGIQAVDRVTIEPEPLRRRAVTIKGVRRFKHTYPAAIELVRTGKVDVRSIVTHRLPLEEIEKAFRLVETYEDGVIKAVIHI